MTALCLGLLVFAAQADVVQANVAPANVAPANVAPANVAPANVAPANVAPASVAPAKVAPLDGQSLVVDSAPLPPIDDVVALGRGGALALDDELRAPPSTPLWRLWLLPVGLAVIAVAVALAKGKQKAARSLLIVERAALAKGRELVVVEAGGRRMLVGVSEAGVAVLADRLPLYDVALDADAPRAAPARHLGGAAFEQHLAESGACAEGDELRRKLAALKGGAMKVSA